MGDVFSCRCFNTFSMGIIQKDLLITVHSLFITDHVICMSHLKVILNLHNFFECLKNPINADNLKNRMEDM